jgi:hypothetical protein
MDDHDQRFKELLREFLRDFFVTFFPDWASRFDFARAEWLEQELHLDPPQGEKRVIDLLAKVANQPAAWPNPPGDPHTLIHLEIESADAAAEFRRRMYEYYVQLRRKHRLAVLPVALFLRVGLDGTGRDAYEDRLAGWPVVRFEYLYVGLPRMDGEITCRGDNPLAIALSALMRLPKENRAAMKLAAVRRIGEIGGTEYRKMLLIDCIEAYWPLTDDERAEYQRLVNQDANREVKAMLTMWDVRVMRRILRQQVEKKFGPLPAEAVARLEAIPMGGLEKALEDVLTATSLADMGLADAPAAGE